MTETAQPAVTAASPVDIVKTSPIRLFQYLIIGVCVLAYAADGFDVVSLAYAGPKLLKEWGITPQMLGVAFAVNPAGLIIGSFFIAPLADRFGRRPVLLTALGVITVSLYLTAMVNTVPVMIFLRLITGIGLGALVVNLNVTVSEFVNDKWRNTLIGVLHSGYTIGSMVGGAVAALVIEPFGWRSVFVSAGILNTATFILAFFLLRESPAFLVARQPRRALERLNDILRRFGHAALAALPPAPSEAARKRGGVASLLVAGARANTILLCSASIIFTLVGTFLANWRPVVLGEAGLSMFWVGISGVVSGGAGLIGHVLVGAIARKVGEIRLTVILLVLFAISMVVFGVMPHGNVPLLIGVTGATTLFNVGAYTALILVALRIYSPESRNAGLGFMLGWARVGGLIGPTFGGYIIGVGLGRDAMFLLFAVMLLIPTVATIIIGRRAARSPAMAAA